MLHRFCNLPIEHSFFLFGPRQCGKTTLILSYLEKLTQVNPSSCWAINLLESKTYLRYVADPSLFRSEILERYNNFNQTLGIVFVDEIQLLMDTTPIKFILTGSSARKLKRGGANLLGGRAIEKHIFPLIFDEAGEQIYDLAQVLRWGSLPSVLLYPDQALRLELLSAYISVYLKEEIQQEAVVRNIPGFVNFLEVAAQQSGQLLNFTAIARDTNLNTRTVQTYYQILEDTLIGIRLLAYKRSVRRRLSHAPKFYIFDLGVLNALERQLESDPDVVRFGKLFEHFIVLETYRLARYLSPFNQVFFWRTKDGLEVDL